MHRIAAFVGQFFTQTIGRARRLAIGYGICAACALLALIELVRAAAAALEPHVGAVFANLILAGSFALAALIAYLVVQSRPKPARAEAAASPLAGLAGSGQRLPPEITLAMLVEAVMIGYSLARRPKD